MSGCSTDNVMLARRTLSAADRDYCMKVTRAALANPFGDDFAAIYRVIQSAAESRDDVQGKTIAAAVSARADKLERAGMADIRMFSGGDREMLRQFFLLDVYYRW